MTISTLIHMPMPSSPNKRSSWRLATHSRNPSSMSRPSSRKRWKERWTRLSCQEAWLLETEPVLFWRSTSSKLNTNPDWRCWGLKERWRSTKKSSGKSKRRSQVQAYELVICSKQRPSNMRECSKRSHNFQKPRSTKTTTKKRETRWSRG